MQFPDRGRKQKARQCNISVKLLRNVVPRQGTEILIHLTLRYLLTLIEKCSSPTGDGNPLKPLRKLSASLLRNVVPRQGTEIVYTFCSKATYYIEKCSSPTGDGNFRPLQEDLLNPIEKCSSPTGDGNWNTQTKESNVTIEKCSSPTGDGNE